VDSEVELLEREAAFTFQHDQNAGRRFLAHKERRETEKKSALAVNMFEIVIKGGIIVDGTGRKPFAADIGIEDGLIAEIGRIDSGAARSLIDADGALVTPGFIDPHGHYDGQLTWDQQLNPSFQHGVTTIVSGNCGIGLAPAHSHDRSALIDVMEGVEDIPGAVLKEGLEWNWETFGDYMNVLESRCYTMDVAVNIAHCPLRVYAMGARALRHERATLADIEVMAALIRDAMRAGAVGFSANRLLEHRGRSGAYIPGTFAVEKELCALAAAMGESGSGVLQIAPFGAVGGYCHDDLRRAEHENLIKLATAARRPLTYLLHQFDRDPEDWRRFVHASETAWRRGVRIYPQTMFRAAGILSGLDGTHVFLRRKSYAMIAHLPIKDRVREMRKPERRAAILTEHDDETEPMDMALKFFKEKIGEFTPVKTSLDYEPETSNKFGTRSMMEGRSVEEYLYDYMIDENTSGIAGLFALNYSYGDLSHVREMIDSPIVMAGLGDGGAHCRLICDASLPTFGLTFWTRDRQRGPRVCVEQIVRKHTRDPACLYGFIDRGVLEVGKRADINVIDHGRLQMYPPEFVHDLPAKGTRLIQPSAGYIATLVKGVLVRRSDEDTGARPGRLYRNQWRADNDRAATYRH